MVVALGIVGVDAVGGMEVAVSVEAGEGTSVAFDNAVPIGTNC